ncbi:MAG: CooT family nickel-binding protein [Candidatus Odinarchaeota archaeon]|nr:CooT family nickel-binding protein [Candidatus Odinarchaeota archaeon]
MCEFKVVIRRGDSEDKIAEDIIKVFYENEKLVLMDILGNKTLVEGALIANVDVSDEKMEILQQPIVGSLIKFLENFLNAYKKVHTT